MNIFTVEIFHSPWKLKSKFSLSHFSFLCLLKKSELKGNRKWPIYLTGAIFSKLHSSITKVSSHSNGTFCNRENWDENWLEIFSHPPPCFCFHIVDYKGGFALAPRAGFSGPWSFVHEQPSTEEDLRTFRFDAKGFTALLDVQHFAPKEISVKTIDHSIVVECKHDSRDDQHGCIERSFVKKFILPYEYDMTTVKSTLSKDGFLQLEAPKPAALQGEERHIEIQHSEKPSFLMSLLSNRANSMLKRSHSIPSDAEDEWCDAV